MISRAYGALLIAVAVTATGCRMCEHPYDYSGPVYDGGPYRSMAWNARAGSILGPGSTSAYYARGNQPPLALPEQAETADASADGVQDGPASNQPAAEQPPAEAPVSKTPAVEKPSDEAVMLPPPASDGARSAPRPRDESPAQSPTPAGGWRPAAGPQPIPDPQTQMPSP
ncbi:MAG: hypothetical protein ABSG68_21305 [Thermoguttaceae bacterium]